MSADPTDFDREQARLSTMEAAEVLEVTPAYVRRLAREGVLEGFQSSVDGRNSWSFDRRTLDAFAEQRQRTAPVGHRGGHTSDSGWAAELLLAENADLQRQLLAQRLEASEQRARELRAHNEELQAEVKRWKALVHTLSAPNAAQSPPLD